MQETDLQLLMDAAKAAGDVATRYAGPKAKSWEKPDGTGPVTEADLAVNDLLEKTLRGARADYGWLSEESQDSAERLAAKRLFVVDPIDGTRSFMEGSRTWAHSLAVVEGDQVMAAVVYLPQRDLLYAAQLGGGAYLNGTRLQASPRPDITGANVLAARPVMDAANWPGGVPDIQKGYRASLAYRLALVAQGRFDAMLTLRPTWDWDVAAGALLLEEAGAVVSDRHGEPLRFNKQDPRQRGILAGPLPLHRALRFGLSANRDDQP